MSARYERDDAGIVHAINPSGAGEDTFCGRNAADGFDPDNDRGFYDEPGGAGTDGGFRGTPCHGPATCPECRDEVGRLRDAMRGLRFRI